MEDKPVLWPIMLNPAVKKGSNKSQKSLSQHLLSFLALSSDFLHFIHGSTIGFSVKNERLITVKKKVNFSCISTSFAVSAAA